MNFPHGKAFLWKKECEIHGKGAFNRMNTLQEETIAAVSTPPAAGGIGIVRISGKDAIGTAQKIFVPKSSRPLCEMKPYTAAYGWIKNGEETLDEAIALVFRSPKSYTGEDVVELSCHGGVTIIRKVLQAAIQAGARAAQPGEFTKRAFLNGKLDLTRAESVMDLIAAQSDAAVRAAQSQHEGALFRSIEKIRQSLIDLASEIAAWVDYPDEDTPALESDRLTNGLSQLADRLEKYINSYERGRILREGADTVIVGRPNTGKSTLMNLLAGCERSIVTAMPGTTRDIIEETVRLGDAVLRLSDTAGLRDTEEYVEQLGVKRARDRMEQADLILAVFDGSMPLQREDLSLIESLKGKRVVAVLNKSDLGQKADAELLKSKFGGFVRLAAKTGEGQEELQRLVEKTLGLESVSFDSGLLANERQLQCASRALSAVISAQNAVQDGITLDAVSVCVDDAIEALSELTGEKASDAVIERVFARFCVGK